MEDGGIGKHKSLDNFDSKTRISLNSEDKERCGVNSADDVDLNMGVMFIDEKSGDAVKKSSSPSQLEDSASVDSHGSGNKRQRMQECLCEVTDDAATGPDEASRRKDRSGGGGNGKSTDKKNGNIIGKISSMFGSKSKLDGDLKSKSKPPVSEDGSASSDVAKADGAVLPKTSDKVESTPFKSIKEFVNRYEEKDKELRQVMEEEKLIWKKYEDNRKRYTGRLRKDNA